MDPLNVRTVDDDRFRPRTPALAACLLVLVAGCSHPVYAPKLLQPEEVPPVSEHPLKVHLTSGDLVVLGSWRSEDRVLSGRGYRYDPARRQLPQYEFHIPMDSIAMLQTEIREGSRPTAVVGMAIWSTLWGVVTLSCLADPKSCFGSCPTFYVDSPNGPVLAAEGFSSSVLRVLEADDLDALYAATSTGGDFRMTMRNEAWETHAVRALKLVAAERTPGGRVMNDGAGRFHRAGPIRDALSCEAAEGDCLDSVARPDGAERTSAADSTDLAATETVELVFEGGRSRQGVVLAVRHSLMSTYLFYESLGYLGSRAAGIWADLERAGADAAREALGIQDLVGRIDIDVRYGDEWVRIGSHDEAGPLATQTVVVPIDRALPDGEPVRIRLTAAKGAWRIDWVAMTDLGSPPATIEVEPSAVFRDGEADGDALSLLLDPDRYLVTWPGDAYDITFPLPPSNSGWDLFLESTGYYYEWMRGEWLDDEDLAMAYLVRSNPAAALRRMAPGYKRAEPRMEELFWSSRFGR